MMLYKPLQAVYITFGGPATKLATFAIPASKHGRQLANEFFISSEDITLSSGYLKGWRIFKITAVILGPKILSELVFEAVQNCKCSGYVDYQQVRSTDQNLFFSKLKLLNLRQLWMKSIVIKQRHRMNLFFVVFCLIVLMPYLMSKLIHSQGKLTCKLLNKITRLLMCMQTNNWVQVFLIF